MFGQFAMIVKLINKAGTFSTTTSVEKQNEHLFVSFAETNKLEREAYEMFKNRLMSYAEYMYFYNIKQCLIQDIEKSNALNDSNVFLLKKDYELSYD